MIIFGFIFATILKTVHMYEGDGLQAGSPWPMFHRNAAHTSQSPFASAGLDNSNPIWQYETNGYIQSSPAISADGICT
jgi:hypothetical protein